ncbi:putative carbonic anhydrase-like protein 1 [Pomacea canaliculata]|uniref:putative carbonic anhydrase-like protein 1 n=1 Tax=Pomacea canaliculata TaxID=400727 RepID=UPI000D72CF94|nr:putative carbonic anhydrase-like protein 1 [Pomacea canaliculata]XP_025088232.1 putative carbonic anhydrase-like protein 1 [Pomacea canaliculata]XP_025088233.1 putative carbonic anhydrase-like protein 1 [Pomacea canaliculata]
MAGTLYTLYPAMLLFLLPHQSVALGSSPWHDWWSYEGISGPDYWGTINPEWALCHKGKQQSPIDIEPSRLLYDPNLKHLKIESTYMKGLLRNTGRDITVELQGEGYSSINISLGPLSYRYRAVKLQFHFANKDTNGSEHRIGGTSFPVEMHVVAYNTDLYDDFASAVKGVKGIAVIAVFMQVGKEANKPFQEISKEMKRLLKKDDKVMVYHLDLNQLLPSTEHYITYDGSLTYPGCYETVTWIILNKPAIISTDQLSSLRVLYNGRENQAELRVAVNARPIMPLNHRVVRTNINMKKRSRLCSMEREMFYQVNEAYLKS